MLQAFQTYIRKESLFEPGQRVLLGVSGGCDSVVMVELFRQSGHPFDIAHCNFMLRGEESERDERFVRDLAERLHTGFFLKRFATSQYARENHLSVQMAARQLRYQWFNELLLQENIDCVATAHHQDDQVETFFINLIRGTGIAGLQGIRPKQGRIIRPLLFATRQEIETFQVTLQLPYCTDSSNLSEKYLRNKVRHQLLPLLMQMNPDFMEGIIQTMDRLKDAGMIFREKVEEEMQHLLVREGQAWKIRINDLRKLPNAMPYLTEILSPLGFTYSTIKNIAHSVDSPPGKIFLATGHCLLKDRDHFMLQSMEALEASPEMEFYIDAGMSGTDKPIRLHFEEKLNESGYQPDKDPLVAEVDLSQIQFPLVIRKWRKGDRFFPFGLGGQKKLSDFFIDTKRSLFEKEDTWLLESDNRIVWVIGQRMDERFRITPQTSRILRIEWER